MTFSSLPDLYRLARVKTPAFSPVKKTIAVNLTDWWICIMMFQKRGNTVNCIQSLNYSSWSMKCRILLEWMICNIRQQIKIGTQQKNKSNIMCERPVSWENCMENAIRVVKSSSNKKHLVYKKQLVFLIIQKSVKNFDIETFLYRQWDH